MSIMRQAFANARLSGEIGEKISRLLSVKSTKKKKSQKLGYEQQLQRSGKRGLGSLRPFSSLKWRPGSPALANGHHCRIMWGLKNEKEEYMVVSYNKHQVTVPGTKATTSMEKVPVDCLSICDCKGYVHTLDCKP